MIFCILMLSMIAGVVYWLRIFPDGLDIESDRGFVGEGRRLNVLLMGHRRRKETWAAAIQ